MKFKEARYGIFTIDHTVMVAHPEVVQAIMGDVIVLRAEFMFMPDHIEYHAYSPRFDIVPSGTEPPDYDVIYDMETGQVTWAKQEA